MKYVIDMKDESNWLNPTKGYNPDGSVSEDGRGIIGGEDLEGRFTFTDSLMYKSPEDGAYARLHEHWKAYETFFVESSSMYFYINGKRTLVEAGKMIHMQPYQAHSFFFNGNVQYRGTFLNWNVGSDPDAAREMEARFPEAKKDPKLLDLLMKNLDLHIRGIADYVDVPPEQVYEVKDPDRPMAMFKLNGAVLKMMVGRWEYGGRKEVWRAEMEPGFHAEWDEYPESKDLFYVQSGKVKFKIYGEEHIAGSDCLVKIPTFAPRCLEVLEDSVMYDVGGMTRWYALCQDYSSLKKFEPEKATQEAFDQLRKQYGCGVKSFGKD